MDQTALLNDLEPVVADLLDKHLASSKEWFPHELVPWGRGRDFEPSEEWDPDEVTMDPAVRSSLFVNLLTEDNLPYYFRTIESLFGKDTAWGTWARRWTAEEGRHSIVMRDYLTVTRTLDPVALERARMHQVAGGQVPEVDVVTDGIVYVTLQELATRIAHHNTGKLIADRTGYEVMKRVAADENRHHIFYRDIGTAALELDPSAMVCAMERQVRDFEMPGTGIIDFEAHARAIARAGIYDFSVHHDSVLVPVILRHWNLTGLTGLTPEAEDARTRLVKRMERIARVGRRFSAKRTEDSVDARYGGRLTGAPDRWGRCAKGRWATFLANKLQTTDIGRMIEVPDQECGPGPAERYGTDEEPWLIRS